jgi:hypothetical protein
VSLGLQQPLFSIVPRALKLHISPQIAKDPIEGMPLYKVYIPKFNARYAGFNIERKEGEEERD